MQQNNQNNQNKNRKQRNSYIIFFVICALLLVGIYLLINRSAKKPDELTQQDFWSYIENDKIDSMTITPAGGENNGFYYITGKYLNSDNEEARYEIYLPVDTVNALILTPYNNGELNYNVKIEVETLTTFEWGTLLSIVVPILLTVFLLIFLFRNAASSNNKAFDFAKNRARLTKKSNKTFT